MLLALAALSFAATARPNIIIVLIDDLGWKDAHSLGSTVFNTPNIDKFVSEGEEFTESYASASVCSPSRAAIMTGQNPARIGITDWLPGANVPNTKLLPPKMPQHLDPSTWTLAEALRADNYSTWLVGKWHIGPEPYGPTAFGFDTNVGGSEAGQPTSYWFPYGNMSNNALRVRNLSGGVPGEYLTDRLTTEAINFIKTRDSRPFFLYFAPYAVHFPLQAKPADLAKYTQFQSADFSKDKVTYAAMVDNLDQNFGKLLQTLHDQGLENNTIVFFTSDNGGVDEFTDVRPLREGKGSLYEGGIRVPLVVRWPGHVPPGTTCAMPNESMDLYPTCLDIAGARRERGQPVDGVSLLPELLDPNAPYRDRALYWHYPHYHEADQPPCDAIRDGEWKLLYWYEDGRSELYNLKDDPSEARDLAATDGAEVKHLKSMLDRDLSNVHAKFPTANPAYKAAQGAR